MYAKQRPMFEQKTASNSVITPVVNNNEVPSINSHTSFFATSYWSKTISEKALIFLTPCESAGVIFKTETTATFQNTCNTQ